MAGLLAAPLPAATPAYSRDEFKTLRKQALRNSRTAEARTYERELYPAIGQDLADLLKKCSTGFPNPRACD